MRSSVVTPGLRKIRLPSYRLPRRRRNVDWRRLLHGRARHPPKPHRLPLDGGGAGIMSAATKVLDPVPTLAPRHVPQALPDHAPMQILHLEVVAARLLVLPRPSAQNVLLAVAALPVDEEVLQDLEELT